MMTPLLSLWLPILIAAVLVFVASMVMHMVLKYHQHDLKKLENESDIADDLRKHAIPPGDYMIPDCRDMKPGSPEYNEKFEKGPVLLMTVLRNEPMNMGKCLLQWFLYGLVVSLFAAYIAAASFPPGAEYLNVFQVSSTVAFVGFAAGLWQNSIWYGKSWRTTCLQTFDGLIYGLIAGGAIAGFWPS